MHPKSLLVKENAAASAQKLTLSALLFLLREQISTPSAPSRLPFPQRFAHCVRHFEKMLYDNSQLARVYLHASTGSVHGFEGRNILEFVGDPEQRPDLAESRRKLFEAQEKRVPPRPR